MRGVHRSFPLLALALLAGCALNPGLETPKLSVVEVQLLGSDLFAQHVRLRLRVQNPNDRALAVRGLTYTVEVAGQQFASGESAASFVVPARGAAEFDTNVTTNLAGTLMTLLSRGAGFAPPDDRVPAVRQAVAVVGPAALDSVRRARQLQPAMTRR